MFKKDRINLRKKSSVYLKGILLITVVGFLFFLSSRFLFPEKLPVLNTKTDEEISITGGGNLTIHSWIYDPSKQEMQVTLITKDIQTANNEIDFDAFQREGNSNLSVKKVYNADGVYITNIDGVSPNYKQIALDVISKDVNLFANSNTHTQSNSKILMTVYNDQRFVKTEKLNTQSQKDYEDFATNVLIDDANQQLKNDDKEISQEKKNQSVIEKQIKTNQENMIYQTSDEQASTQSIIDGYKQMLDDSNGKIAEIQSEKVLLNDKLNKLEMRKNNTALNENM